jgi:hypothetical protein
MVDESKNEPDKDREEGVLIWINGFPLRVSAIHTTIHRAGQPVEHRESGDFRQASDAAIASSGELRETLRGLPYRGEENTLDLCRHLVQEWRRRGLRLHSPRLSPEHDDSDCLCASLDDPTRDLRIQVIKAVVDADLWAELARAGNVAARINSPADAADLLRQAIEKKAERTPPAQRAKLVLALDAMGSASVALGPVIEQFRLRHGAWSKALGFQSVWIAGRSQHMIYRLDERDRGDVA